MSLAIRACLLSACLSSGFLFAQPVVRQVSNNASYALPGLPNAGIAQGSIFAVFGDRLGPAQLTQAGFPLPNDISGTSIRISSGGTAVNANMIYAVAGQLAAVLPSSTPPGNATLTVTANGQTSAPFAITVVRNAFGIFTLNGAGTGPGVITDANFQPLTLTSAGRANQVAILWGTGLGGVNFPDNQSAQAGDLNVAVEVLVGGKPANIRYKGRAPCCAGLDQIVFDIPPGVNGCYVSVLVRVAGVNSNYASLAVSESGPCSEPGGFSAADLSAAIDRGSMRVGSISMSRARIKMSVPGFGELESSADVAGASFFQYDTSALLRSQGSNAVTIGDCMVFAFSGDGYVDPIRPTPLDAGAALTLNGPKGAKNLPRQTPGTYSAQLGGGLSGLPAGLPGGIPGLGGGDPPYLDPGRYTTRGSGGADVGAFEAAVDVPQFLNWTNRDSIARVQRASPLTVTWTGGGADDTVFITGTSGRVNPTVGAAFFCSERASAGRFTVPAAVLSSLPPSASVSGAPTGTLTLMNSPLTDRNRFTAPGIDFGTFTYTNSETKTLEYQ